MPPEPARREPALDDIRRAVSLINISFRQPRFYDLMAARAQVQVSAAQMRVLARIGDRDDLRIKDLAEILALDVTTVSRFVGGLEQNGLIERRRLERDGRSATVQLTAAGRTTLDRLLGAWDSVLTDVLAGSTPEEIEQCRAAFVRFADGLEAFHATYLGGAPATAGESAAVADAG